MARIKTMDPAGATGATKELLEAVRGKLGVVPNMIQTMAQSPALLKGYLSLGGALEHGVLAARLREMLAITVAQANGCDYCLSVHTALGRKIGIGEEDLGRARSGGVTDEKAEAGLRFARQVLEARGLVADAELERVRKAGYSDPEIMEIVAHVALNILTNYFNGVAETDLDFARVKAAA